MTNITKIRLFISPVGGIKSDYNIGRYKNPSRTIEDYRVFTDNGSLNLEIDYADYKDYDWRNTKIAYDKLTDKDVRDFFKGMAKRKPAKHISDIRVQYFHILLLPITLGIA